MEEDTWKDYFIKGKALELKADEEQLLCDNYFVEDYWNLSRCRGKVFKHEKNPLLKANGAWEDIIGNPCVLYDKEEDIFHMWYTVYNKSSGTRMFETKDWTSDCGPPYFSSYARSSNGLDWEKPGLGIVNYQGNTENNIILKGYQRSQSIRVIENPKPSENKLGRFLLTHRDIQPDYGMSLWLFHSDDGLNWTSASEKPLCTGIRDTLHNIIYDPELDLYRLYTRPTIYASLLEKADLPEQDSVDLDRRRRGAVSFSKDLRSWSPPRTVLFPDNDDNPDFDDLLVYRYGSHFIGFTGSMDIASNGAIDTMAMFSKDGVNWQRPHRNIPFISRGEKGSFDHGMAMSPKSMLSVGNELWMYYPAGTKGQISDDGERCIALATIKKGRFSGWCAGKEGGFLLTKEFIWNGRGLKVNCNAESGFVYAELLSPTDGSPLALKSAKALPGFSLKDCVPVREDSTSVDITWNTSSLPKSLNGKPVYIRFYLRDAYIFSFTIKG